MQITADSNPLQAGATSATRKGASGIGADFQTFLRMLTTQMQNQDPLNPMEATDLAVQLATFAGVEQQTRSNQLLEGIAARLGQAGMAELAGWIGLEAQVPGPVRFNGAPITLAPEVPAGAESAVLVVRDRAGAEVAREPLPAGARQIDWAGTGRDGRPLAPGDYSLSVEAYSGGTLVGEAPVRSYAAVTEARMSPSGTVELVLAGGATVDAASVTGLRRPDR
jgi:flagellar basal-body rod modification protein FlgD